MTMRQDGPSGKLDRVQRAAAEQFSRQSHRYGRGHILEDTSDVRAALAHVALPNRASVLDVATGGGHTGLLLASLGHDVTLADISETMLKRVNELAASRGFSVTTRQHPAEVMPYPDASFDLVTCRVAPHHFPDCAKFVREMARVLKPGGIAAMIDNVVPEDRATGDYINAFEKFRDPSHVRALPATEWLRLFTEAGFMVDTTEIFRKARDFEAWAGLQTVSDAVRSELRRRLKEVPPGAAEALGPETREGKLYFYLTEILVVGRLTG